MKHFISQIESILFVASKPLSFKTIATAVGISEGDAREAVEALVQEYNREDSGIHILVHEGEAQMGTNPSCADAVDQFVRDDISGELTKAQLETLTVIAYQGPITRPEIERIRGVNCAVILRNLSVRGLIQETEDGASFGATYALSFDALRHLGISRADALPEYESLHAHPHVEHVVSTDETEQN